MKRAFLFALVGVLATAMLAGCGTKNPSTTTPTAGASQVVMTMGDAPADRVIAFALTINNMTLTGGSNPPVVTTPTRIEFVRNAGTFQPLVSAQVASGTYTGASISVSSPQVVAIDTTTRQPVTLTAALSTSTVNVTFNNPLTINNATAEVNFDLDLANSVTISGTTATINPVFHVSSKIVHDQDNDDLQDIRGVVSSVMAPGFTVTSPQMLNMFNFTTNSNTKFEGITGLSQLSVGMIIEVDAQVQSDGTLLAKRIDADEDSDNGLAIEGFTTSITGNPATQFRMIEQFDSSMVSALLNILGIGDTITVNVGSSTTFNVSDTDVLSLSGLNVSFDAADLGMAQRVEASASNQAMLQATGLVLTADRVRLLQQTLNGTVSNASGNTFTLTVAPDSAFALLSGQTTLTVETVGGTQEDLPVSDTAAVTVRGLLFFSGTAQTYTLVVSHVEQQQ